MDDASGHGDVPVKDSVAQWILLSGLVCSGFASIASLVIGLKLWQLGHDEEGLVLRLLLKGEFFAGLFGACAYLTHRTRDRILNTGPDRADIDTQIPWLATGLVGLFLILVAFPRLDAYPWTAPDELHHLVVSRNIAEHSAYASGNPEIGFIYFDHVDSVGPSVLAPVAAAFSVFSPTLILARVVMGLFFLVFALGIFVLVREHWGSQAGLLSVLLTTLSFGTIYLGRSLYGEVPAMMFLVWSMICWGRSIEAERGHLFALLAGILWRLGILAKTFLFLSAFPIIAVWIYDRLTTKRIDWSCVALPALGGVGVLGAWYGVVNHFSYLVPDEISTLFLYRHYLMFGIPSTLNGLMWFLQQPVYLVGLIGIVWFTVTYLFRGKMNPALLVLLMTAELYLFWWLFFTPSTISRYTWYSCAILGIFSGPALLQGVELVRSSATGRARKIGVAIVCGAILLSAGFRLIEQLDLIYVKDEAWE